MKPGTLVTPVGMVYVFFRPFPEIAESCIFEQGQIGIVLGQSITELCILTGEHIGWVTTERVKTV